MRRKKKKRKRKKHQCSFFCHGHIPHNHIPRCHRRWCGIMSAAHTSHLRRRNHSSTIPGLAKALRDLRFVPAKSNQAIEPLLRAYRARRKQYIYAQCPVASAMATGRYQRDRPLLSHRRTRTRLLIRPRLAGLYQERERLFEIEFHFAHNHLRRSMCLR